MMIESDRIKLDSATALAGRVARAIIPELTNRPLYIVQPVAGSLLSHRETEGRSGLYYVGLDSALQPMLEAQGRWRGPGVAIGVDAFMCFASAYSDSVGEQRVIGTVLHELAHWLDYPEPSRAAPPSHADFIEATEARKQEELQPRQFSLALLTHSDSFIRLCCHLWYRAAHGGGRIVGLQYLQFGNQYSGLEMLEAPSAYVVALGDELQRYQGWPLRSIAKINPPEAFTELWDAALTCGSRRNQHDSTTAR